MRAVGVVGITADQPRNHQGVWAEGVQAEKEMHPLALLEPRTRVAAVVAVEL
jgi:hypothetical protein